MKKIIYHQKTFILFSIVILCCVCIGLSASVPAGETIFKIDTIHEVRIIFSQSHAWDTLISRYDASHDSIPEDDNPLMASVQIDGKKLDSIGVKLKSHLSYTIPTNKKPIKLYFNAFVKGRTFDGLLRLNLSNEFPDPSMLRNTVAYKIFRDAGVRAPRTSFARVYVNGIYKGLYVMIEQIDKVFLSHHFKNYNGELIKPVGAYLFWFPDDTISFWKSYEIKTKNTPAARVRLCSLAKKINTTPANVFYDSLQSIFDFNSYVSVFAADIIFNNWDSYFYGQNYYLYRDSSENKYYYLPWDYNVSLNNYDVSGGDYSILPGAGNTRLFDLPLPNKVVYNDKLKALYLEELKRINKYMSVDSLHNFMYRMHDLIRPALKEDSEKVFTMEQFDNSLLQRINISDIEFEGLLTFIRYRHDQIYKMLLNAGVR